MSKQMALALQAMARRRKTTVRRLVVTILEEALEDDMLARMVRARKKKPGKLLSQVEMAQRLKAACG